MRFLIRLAIAGVRIIGRLTYHAGLAHWWIARRPWAVRVLAYHAVEGEESSFTRGLACNVRPEHFEEHLNFFRQHYDVISTRDLFARRRPARSLCITFDDGYQSVMSNAFPRLRRHSMPATVYLVARAIDSIEVVWVNVLNWYLEERGDVAKSAVRAALERRGGAVSADLVSATVFGLPRAEIEQLIDELHRVCGEPVSEQMQAGLFLTWAEIREMQQGGLSFGNHTARHPNLQLLSAEETRSEMEETHALLVRELGQCDGFAYPFGSVSETAEIIARELGYAYCMELSPRPHDSASIGVDRVLAPNAGTAELFAELEFVHPLKRLLRGA